MTTAHTTMCEKQWTLKALTPIWAGDASGQPGHFIPTGLLGSLRWWFEVLVRGLGGHACDPTAPEVRCPDNRKNPGDRGHHCVVCELFGCTGWARKFRLMVLDEGNRGIQDQIEQDQTFVLRFIPLRPVSDEEWYLLHATLRLIADYGAIGGKTVLKPSDEPGRENARHHLDFGLVELKASPVCIECSQLKAEEYIQAGRWKKPAHEYTDTNGHQHDFSWASLKNFWCVKGLYLAREDEKRSSFNRVIGRRMEKDRAQQLFRDTALNRWLAGRQQESKKVFSFKHPKEKERTFGFVKPGLISFDEIKSLLEDAWGSDFENKTPFKRGCQILPMLFR